MPKASASAAGNFKPCPAGSVQGILVDVIDLGMITSTFADEEKTRHMVNLVWQVDERRDDGKRFLIFQRLGLSLHPKATLRAIVETLLGRGLSEEEAAEGIELNDLKGSQAILSLIHNKSGDRTYTNVKSVGALMKGMPKLEAEPFELKVKAQDEEQSPF
jgi:hypothetical protein